MKRAHHHLEAWQQALGFVKTIYSTTSTFPKNELYGLASQMRRAAVSIPSNIAEGAARDTTAEFLRFLFIARGSLAELETQILVANELGYVNDPQPSLKDLYQVNALLDGLIRSLKARPTRVKDEGPDYDEALNAAE